MRDMSQRPDIPVGADSGLAGTIAAVVALTAYALAIVAGLAAQNPATTILWRGMVVLVVAHLAGQLIGAAAEHALAQHLRRFEEQNPVPDLAVVERELERQRREAAAARGRAA